MNYPKRESWLYALIFLVFTITGCITDSTKDDFSDAGIDTLQSAYTGELRKVTLLPYWITTAQFAGYYVGKQNGIFKKHGIDLEIITYSPFMNSQAIIQEGKTDFFLSWLVNAIELKATGTDIVNIAQLSSRSSLMLLAKKSSGINSIRDLNGKKAGIWSGYELQPRALFQKFDLNVTLIPIGSTNNLFLSDGVQITNANWFDEYHSILNSGYDEEELITFFFADYGLNFLEDGIYCMKSLTDEDPELCRRFVEASLESWKYVFNHPDESINIILDEQMAQKQPANRPHQKWMLDRYRDLYYPRQNPSLNTYLNEADYHTIATILLQAGLISSIPAYTAFFKPYLTLGKSDDN